MSFAESICNDIKPDITKLLRCKFITDLVEGKAEREDLRLFAEQYYILSNAFNNFLFLACTRIPTEEDRFHVIENIYDEHGRGNINRSHRNYLGRFLNYLGVNDFSNLKPLPSTSANIYGMEKLCGAGTVLEVLGALGPGCESFTSVQYELIYDSLVSNYKIPKDALVFFKDHIEHDDAHSEGINQVIDKLCCSSGDATQVLSGAKQAIIFEGIFWEGLAR